MSGVTASHNIVTLLDLYKIILEKEKKSYQHKADKKGTADETLKQAWRAKLV